MIVTVSSKGQIVIPAEIRRAHGIKAGDKLQIVDLGTRIVLARAMEDPIHESFGMLKGGPSLTEALLEERRKELEREERKIRRWQKK